MHKPFDTGQLKPFQELSDRSVPEICNYIGKSPSAYYRYEEGHSRPNDEVIIKLCDILRCQPNDLLGFDNDPSPWSNYGVTAARLVDTLKSNQDKEVAIY